MKRISSDPATVLTVNALARYLKVNPGTVYRLLKAGKLPGFRVGSDWRFRREVIDRWRVGQREEARYVMARIPASCAPSSEGIQADLAGHLGPHQSRVKANRRCSRCRDDHAFRRSRSGNAIAGLAAIAAVTL
jgi:excisionase family DNA binding protein